MKFTKQHRALKAIVAAVVVAIISCTFIDNVNQPEEVYTETPIDVTVDIRVVPEENESGCILVFGMAAPKSLNLAANATLTLKTLNYGELLGITDLNEKLTVMPADELATNPADKTWVQAFTDHYGFGAENEALGWNTDNMEWVIWQSSTAVDIIDDKVGDNALNAQVTISFPSGEEELECYIGYAMTSKLKGFDGERPTEQLVLKPLTIEKYVAPSIPAMVTVPSVFRYGDIFGFEFSGLATDLEGVEDVYLCAKAVYNGGQEVEVSTCTEANKMTPFVRTLLDGTSYDMREKFIYPKHFFGLEQDDVIEAIYVWFSNADGTKVVKDGDEPYFIAQAEGTIIVPDEPEDDDTTGDDDTTEGDGTEEGGDDTNTEE